MNNRWNDIVTAVYSLTDLQLTESRAHFSTHFFIESSQGQFVLSCSPFQADRMVKSYQFQLMEVLKDNGFRTSFIAGSDAGWKVLLLGRGGLVGVEPLHAIRRASSVGLP